MFEIIPFKRFGQFEFNKNIDPYLIGVQYDFCPKEEGESWDTYSFGSGILDIYTAEGIIESISCRGDCYLEGIMLIGMSIFVFETTFNISLSLIKKEQVYFYDDSMQEVYEVESLGLQIWVDHNNVIVTVIAYS
ncbi:hypothetical protein ACE38W_03925 [Chitinophaga sp. Hz27]|uniref:hypothetical protein n=1 Tax=Chitinophaga sp. Hz27 TaxID=3347169 RepID=UPI0035DE391B